MATGLVFFDKENLAFVEEKVADPLPDDYEACEACGYDHYYHYGKASQWHIDSRAKLPEELQ